MNGGAPWPGHPYHQHPMPPWNGHMPGGPAGPWPPPGGDAALRVPAAGGQPVAGGPGSTSGDAPGADAPTNSGGNAPSVSSKDAAAQAAKAGAGWRDPWTNSSVSNADPWAALPAESDAWNGLRPAMNGEKAGFDDKGRPAPGGGGWIPKGRCTRSSARVVLRAVCHSANNIPIPAGKEALSLIRSSKGFDWSELYPILVNQAAALCAVKCFAFA